MKINKLLPVTIALCSLAQPTSAAVVFNFNFADVTNNTGVGFDDAILGSTRRAALQSAASSLGSYFTSNSTLNIDVNNSLTSGTGALASAAPSFFVTNNTFQQSLAQIQVQNGSLSSNTHGFATWDFGYNYDLDDSISTNAFDFKSIAIHELTHVLGFGSAISASGDSLFTTATNLWTDFDQLLVDGDGNRLINDDVVKNFNASELNELTGGTGTDPVTSGTGIYFNGANAVAANNGEAVAIYSPTVFDAGSSLSHLDTDFFGTNNFITTHAISTGQGVREFSSIELGIFQDLGFDIEVTAVPVPPALFLFGSGLMALFGFRRKNS